MEAGAMVIATSSAPASAKFDTGTNGLCQFAGGRAVCDKSDVFWRPLDRRQLLTTGTRLK